MVVILAQPCTKYKVLSRQVRLETRKNSASLAVVHVLPPVDGLHPLLVLLVRVCPVHQQVLNNLGLIVIRTVMEAGPSVLPRKDKPATKWFFRDDICSVGTKNWRKGEQARRNECSVYSLWRPIHKAVCLQVRRNARTSDKHHANIYQGRLTMQAREYSVIGYRKLKGKISSGLNHWGRGG